MIPSLNDSFIEAFVYGMIRLIRWLNDSFIERVDHCIIRSLNDCIISILLPTAPIQQASGTGKRRLCLAHRARGSQRGMKQPNPPAVLRWWGGRYSTATPQGWLAGWLVAGQLYLWLWWRTGFPSWFVCWIHIVILNNLRQRGEAEIPPQLHHCAGKSRIHTWLDPLPCCGNPDYLPRLPQLSPSGRTDWLSSDPVEGRREWSHGGRVSISASYTAERSATGFPGTRVKQQLSGKTPMLQYFSRMIATLIKRFVRESRLSVGQRRFES
jgi:hypothetical protein